MLSKTYYNAETKEQYYAVKETPIKPTLRQPPQSGEKTIQSEEEDSEVEKKRRTVKVPVSGHATKPKEKVRTLSPSEAPDRPILPGDAEELEVKELLHTEEVQQKQFSETGEVEEMHGKKLIDAEESQDRGVSDTEDVQTKQLTVEKLPVDGTTKSKPIKEKGVKQSIEDDPLKMDIEAPKEIGYDFHRAPLVPDVERMSVYYVINEKNQARAKHPAYYDQQYNVYYYPKWLLKDPNYKSYPLVQNPPKFMYDIIEDYYMHPETGEQYVLIEPSVNAEPNLIIPEFDYSIYYVDETKEEVLPEIGDELDEYRKAARNKKTEKAKKLREARKRKQEVEQERIRELKRKKIEQAADNLPWGVELEEYVMPELKTTRIQRQAYFHLKDEGDKHPVALIRRIPMYSNPYNLINDTLLPFGLSASAAISGCLFNKRREF